MAGQLDDKAHWPLGKPTVYGNNYDPSLLQPIQRSESRQALGFTTNDTLPFHGTDIWNAYELSWLETSGKPAVGRLVLEIPAAVPQTVESKSLKLYLGSFSQTAYASSEQVMAAIERDLTALLGGCVNASLVPLEPNEDAQTSPLQKPYLNAGGSPVLLDELDVTCEHYHPNPELLRCDATRVVNKGTLYTHLFRSLCPVTGQPDWASVMVRYSGREIAAASLLQYLVSFRLHQGFHESCVERLFMEIKQQCAPTELSVYARFARRGGIDINPFRSDFEAYPDNLKMGAQ